jgi:hypothetical protein
MPVEMNHWPFVLTLASMLIVSCSSVRERTREAEKATADFHDYAQVFRFIAAREELPVDEGTIFRLAADSSVEVWHFDDIPILYVITAHYYAGGLYDQIRGAQNNGRYYLLRPFNQQFTAAGNLDRGFELVGIAEGNTYRWETLNSRRRLITTWHLSASESPTNTYEWNGKKFE